MIKLQDQEHLHNPETGVYGDCFRAVLATLLGKPVQEVPHFLHDGCDTQIFNRRISEFLQPLGYAFMSVPEFDVQRWKLESGIRGPVFHEISGTSPRDSKFLHAVVGVDGDLLHDPHPSRAGLAGGSRQFGFLVLTHPESHQKGNNDPQRSTK